MKIDAEKTFNKLQWTIGRTRHNLWCSPAILQNFKSACQLEGLDYSPVLQDLMSQFLEFKKKPNFETPPSVKRKTASLYCSEQIYIDFDKQCREWLWKPFEVWEVLMLEYVEQVEDKHGKTIV